MLRRGLGELGGGGKMDEAVALIGLRSEKLPIGLGRPPQRLLADFVDRRHLACFEHDPEKSIGFPATGRDPIGAKPLFKAIDLRLSRDSLVRERPCCVRP